MVIGIAIDKDMIILDTFIYPSSKDVANINNVSNLEKNLLITIMSREEKKERCD